MIKFNLLNVFKKRVNDDTFNSQQFQTEALAYASYQFEENNMDYNATKNSLEKINLNDRQKDIIIEKLKYYHELKTKNEIFDNLVRQSQTLINEGRKAEAFDLALTSYKENQENIRLIELIIDIAETFQTENEVIQLFERLMQISHSQKNNIEYRKGLYLKRKKRFEEAKNVFSTLNAEHEFAWNYYQIAIIENLIGDKASCYNYLERTFEIDPGLREDAKNFPELSNLYGERKFILLTT